MTKVTTYFLDKSNSLHPSTIASALAIHSLFDQPSNMDSSHSPPPRPAFSDLPLRKDGPRGNIWGLFGEKDELGLLNYITPEVIRHATEEIKSGIRIPLDLPLNYCATPPMGRQQFKHEIKRFEQHFVNDDVVTMNTQSGTQWDGFRHWGTSEFRYLPRYS